MDSFLVTNNLGGYFWHTPKPTSRYQGWFMPFDGRLFKIIDFVEGDLRSVHFPKYYKSLIITAKAPSVIKLSFDIRESYNAESQWGREYHITEKDGILWVRYTLENIIVGIKIKGGFKLVNKWTERRYSLDEKRHSSPASLWIFEALEIFASKVCIAAGRSEKEVIKELQKAATFRIKKSPAIVKLKEDVHNFSLAYKLAKFSLLSLRVFDEKKHIVGLYAGLPWFFQFWLRDEAVSFRGFAPLMYKEAKALASLRAKFLSKDSIVPAYLDLKSSESRAKSVDGFFWMALRLKELGVKKYIQLSADTEFVLNKAKETWMDSISRQGARIELQALKLALLKENRIQKDFHEKVRTRFFDGEILIDGIEPDGTVDKTVRPNCFLAHYLYPVLLTQEEWEVVFDKALISLWCVWGGLATLDKAHPQFQGRHTGEVNTSYHQGDSWFWINNIAAISMRRLNKEKYKNFIQKIIEASAQDILSEGIPGHASELSSANEFDPAGSPAQLWSAATFIELYQELKAR